jgi:fatty acid desaturase
MTTESTSQNDAGGTGLLLVVSIATVLVVIAEGVFIAFASWWMLPLMMLGIILMAGLVIGAVIRTIDDGSLAGGRAKPREVAEPAAAEAARPLPRVVTGH